MVGGQQQIWAGNSGSITTMSGVSAMQIIGLSGVANGSIDTLEAGTQMIGYSTAPYKGGGTGTINVMNSGMQIVGYSGCSSCIGTIASMNNGQQQVNDGGTGTITKMSGVDASQIIGLTGSSAVGSIEIMEAGKQAIGYNGNFGTGSITLMQDGVQIIGYVGGSGIGTIATMSGGTQIINNAGTGTVTALLGGSQIVASGGTATDATVGSGGLQYIEAGAAISGTVLDGGILRLAQADSDYTLNNTLTINNGILDLTDGAGLKRNLRNLRAAPVYQKLTMSDLQGSWRQYLSGYGSGR